jgi:hypothetical protein
MNRSTSSCASARPPSYLSNVGVFFDLVISKRLFEASQLTGDEEPAFGSIGEAPAVPLVAAGFRQLLFGNGAALGRRNEKHAALQITPRLCAAIADGAKMVCPKRNNYFTEGDFIFVAGTLSPGSSAD